MHKFPLGESTVIVDWREVKRSMPSQAEDANAASAKQAKAKGPAAPGQGSAKYASLLQDLEARYLGGKVVQEDGYEFDDFVVSDEEDSGYYEDEDDISPEDFFVTQGPTDRRKRTHDEVLPDILDEAASTQKKQKLQEDLSGLPIPVRDAVAQFQESWLIHTKGKPPSQRFPSEMEAALAIVGQVAMAHHQKGYISTEVVEALESITGFSGATIKPRMKKGAPDAGAGGAAGNTNATPGRPAGASPIATNGPNPDAITYLKALGGDFETILAIQDDATRNADLQRVMEAHLEDLSVTIKNFAANFTEPPKRSPWNDAIRTKLKTLFAINDAISPPPLAPSTLRTHILSLWPADWEVKDTQIKPQTRYQPKPPKAPEPSVAPK
jgi:hypothetical protein